jgi:hypothetical protein
MWYTRLIALRAAHPSLQQRELRLLDVGSADQVLAYLRPSAKADESVIVLLNYGAEPAHLTLPIAAREPFGGRGLVDLMSNELQDDDRIALPAYGVRILTAAPPSTTH